MGNRLSRPPIVLLTLVTLTAGAAPLTAQELTIFAAASLKNALDETISAWPGEAEITVSYAGTQILARQIGRGAEADVFIAADEAWMDELERSELIDGMSRTAHYGNALVVVAPSGSTIEAPADLAALPGALGPRDRVAIANTRSVPAGRYTRAALEALGLWGDLGTRAIDADSVRAALIFVARGETPIGFVYATDARIEPRVKVVAEVPPSLHPPIRYPAAAVTGADDMAHSFLDHLGSDDARAIFRAHGFQVLTDN